MAMPASSSGPTERCASSRPMPAASFATSSARCKIKDNPWLEPKFARLLALARRVLAQERGQRGPKV
jgi:hypothetical protein